MCKNMWKERLFAMNAAPDWFMLQSPLLLGRIHNELHKYKELPMGNWR